MYSINGLIIKIFCDVNAQITCLLLLYIGHSFHNYKMNNNNQNKWHSHNFEISNFNTIVHIGNIVMILFSCLKCVLGGSGGASGKASPMPAIA